MKKTWAEFAADEKINCYFDCVQYFKAKAEAAGYRWDFIDNVYTGRQFLVLNGHRVGLNPLYQGKGIGDVSEVFKAMWRAYNMAAWQCVNA